MVLYDDPHLDCCCLECTFMWHQEDGRIKVTVRLIKAVAKLRLHSHDHRGMVAA